MYRVNALLFDVTISWMTNTSSSCTHFFIFLFLMNDMTLHLMRFIFFCGCSEILGVATLGTILASVLDGKVRPSDAVSMVLCKDFRKVSEWLESWTSWEPWTVNTLPSMTVVSLLTGEPDRPPGLLVLDPQNTQLCPRGAWSRPLWETVFLNGFQLLFAHSFQQILTVCIDRSLDAFTWQKKRT